MRFKVKFSDGEKTVEFVTGRSSLWHAHDAAASFPNNTARSGRLSFAWGYIAAKQAGKLADLGIMDETELSEAIDKLADEWDLVIDEENTEEDEAVPLEGSIAK